MKTYVHDPNIYRNHYGRQVGSALPGFRGMRMHQEGYGIGAFLGKLARKAIPLILSGLKSGARIAKPHVKKAATGIAKDVSNKFFQEVTNRGNKRKKATNGPVRRRKKVKRTTSKDIFD